MATSRSSPKINIRSRRSRQAAVERSAIAFALDAGDASLSAFRLATRCPLHTLASMTDPGKAALDAMVAEATIDCYDEEERLTGFATMIDENLEVPFTTRILGFAVTVTSVRHTSHGLVADCVYDQHAQAIHVLDLPMPEPPPKGAEWIAAYRHWARW